MKNKLSILDWILATRPWSYTASAMPIITTLSFILYTNSESLKANWIYGLMSIITIIILHCSGNLISDYYDYIKGVDRQDTYGQKNLYNQKFKAKSILRFGLICLVIAGILGLYIAFNTHYMVFILGTIGGISALFYYFFKKYALGDLLIFLSFGLLPVIGTGYMMENQLNPWLFLLAFPIGTITIAILHSNNTRDIGDDNQAGLTTLASLLGIKTSIKYYYLLIISSYFIIVFMIIMNVLPWITLFSLITLPIAIKNLKTMKKSIISHHKIHNLDQDTAKLQLGFTACLSISLIIGYLI